MEHTSDLIFSSKVESLVADVQDEGALIVIQVFLVPTPYDCHVQLVVGRNLNPIRLFLSNMDEEFCPVVGIVGK